MIMFWLILFNNNKKTHEKSVIFCNLTDWRKIQVCGLPARNPCSPLSLSFSGALVASIVNRNRNWIFFPCSSSSSSSSHCLHVTLWIVFPPPPSSPQTTVLFSSSPPTQRNFPEKRRRRKNFCTRGSFDRGRGGGFSLKSCVGGGRGGGGNANSSCESWTWTSPPRPPPPVFLGLERERGEKCSYRLRGMIADMQGGRFGHKALIFFLFFPDRSTIHFFVITCTIMHT